MSTRRHPEISVVMGVYNAGDALRATVDSILSQTFGDFELLVVNDGSTDSTRSLLETYEKSDARVRVLEQSHSGLTRALILGCGEAKGRLIARHDCGDVSMPERFERQQETLTGPGSPGFVSCLTRFEGPCGEFMFFSDGGCSDQRPFSVAEANRSRHGVKGPSHHGSVMMKRACYEDAGGYRAAFVLSQDWDLWYRVGEIASFSLLQEVLYRARHTVGGLSLTRKKEQARYGKLAHDCLLARKARGDDSPVLAAFPPVNARASAPPSSRDTAKAYYFIGECLRKNRDLRAREYFIQSLHKDPFCWKSWIRLFQARWNLHRHSLVEK